MTPKSSKMDIAFKATPKGKNKAQMMTMGLTLKAMFNRNDFNVIRWSLFYSIFLLNFTQNDSLEVLFFELFNEV